MTDVITCCSISSDSSVIACGSALGYLHIWFFDTMQILGDEGLPELRSVKVSEDAILTVKLCGQYTLLVGTKESLFLFESVMAISEAPETAFSIPFGAACICQISDNEYALGLTSGSVVLFDTSSKQVTGNFKTPLSALTCLVLADGQLFCGGKGSEIVAIDLLTRAVVGKWKLPGEEAISMSLTRNWLAVISAANRYKTFLSFVCLKAFPIADVTVEGPAVLTGVSFIDTSTMLLTCFGPGQLQAKLDGVISACSVNYSGAIGSHVSSRFIAVFGVGGLLLLNPNLSEKHRLSLG